MVVPRYLPPSAHFCTSCTLFKEKYGKGQEKGGIIKKFKKMMKDYWYVLIPVHVATSLVWFGGGFVLQEKVRDLLDTMGPPKTSDKLTLM